jgi:DHA1 family bicyclomycin/chloramphenicol resistance-like MFS transporter
VNHGPPPADVATVATRTPWRLMWLLIAMTAIGPMSLNIVTPALPALAHSLVTDTATAQLTVSLFLLGMASAQLAVGPLADKFGRRPVLLGGLALAVVACLGCAAAANISQLVIARIFQALGTVAGVVISRAIIRDLFERDRAASLIGLVSTAMVLAPMIAPLIGGVLDTNIGWRAIFLFVAACGLIVLAWAALALPETGSIHDTARAGLLTDLRALVGSASFFGYGLAGAFGSASYYSFLGGSPHVTVSIMGHSSAEYGIWFVVAAFGYMAGNFTVSRLTERFGIQLMIFWGFVIQGIGLVIGILMAMFMHHLGPIVLFLPQAVSAFGNGLILPTAIAGAISVRPQASATSAGIAGFLQMGIGAIVVQITGYVVAASTSAVPLAVTMTLMVVFGAISFALVRPKNIFRRAFGL